LLKKGHRRVLQVLPLLLRCCWLPFSSVPFSLASARVLKGEAGRKRKRRGRIRQKECEEDSPVGQAEGFLLLKIVVLLLLFLSHSLAIFHRSPLVLLLRCQKKAILVESGVGGA